MSDTAISILQKAADLGLKLGLKQPGTLTVESAKRWPGDFADVLRDYKPRLITLLQLPFLMVNSERLGETIFFCPDKDTKAVLSRAGAPPACVYTREELRVLVEQHRRKPLTAAELLHIHRARRAFSGKLTR
jgi:hypothetical protein